MSCKGTHPVEKVFAAIEAFWFVTRTNLLAVFIGLLFLLAISSNLGMSYYHGKWVGFGAICVALLGIEAWRRYGAFASLKLSYVLGHVLYFLVYPDNRYAPVQAYDLTALKLFFAESGFKLLLVLFPLFIVKIDRQRMLEIGGQIACAFCVINIASVAWQLSVNGCSDVNSCGGILLNPSLNACMAAVCLPFVFKNFSKPAAWCVLSATVLTALMGKTSLGIGMVAAFLALKDCRLLLAAPIILGLGWYHYGPQELFSSGDRWPMWKFFMEQWARNPVHWLFGTGFGSFGVFSINLQNAHSMRTQYWWIWLHNDWLQAIFETGLIGFSLLLGTFLTGLRNLWKRREVYELQSLLLFGLMMAWNYPLHVGLTCAFGALLILVALERNQPHNINQGERL